MEDGATVKTDLEEQFILRLPPAEAELIHNLLKTKPMKVKKTLKIDLNLDERRGTVHINKTKLPAVLLKLPTITESCKTNICNNKSVLYKTADISEMLLCDSPGGSNMEYPHGLTPPLKNIRRRRFRKTLINTDKAIEVENVVKELYYLLRADLEAVSTKFEVVYENRQENELSLFGHLSTDSETSNGFESEN